jgi:hypothetical protein
MHHRVTRVSKFHKLLDATAYMATLIISGESPPVRFRTAKTAKTFATVGAFMRQLYDVHRMTNRGLPEKTLDAPFIGASTRLDDRPAFGDTT